MPLFPTPPEKAGVPAADAKVELVEALADLLLEALGPNEEGGDDESENHS
jgi:hypothetical protein